MKQNARTKMSAETAHEIAEELQRIREQTGKTPAIMAEQIGIGYSTYCALEAESRPLTWRIYSRVTAYLTEEKNKAKKAEKTETAEQITLEQIANGDPLQLARNTERALRAIDELEAVGTQAVIMALLTRRAKA